MGGGGRHRVLIGAWPAWTGRRKLCHNRGNGAGAGAGASGGVEKAPPQMRQAQEPTGGASLANPGGELGDRKAGRLQAAANALRVGRAAPAHTCFDIRVYLGTSSIILRSPKRHPLF